jgi:formyltetrahydrofolate deformylase
VVSCTSTEIQKHTIMRTSAVLLISCPDRKGLVATVSDFIYRHGGNILHTDEHTDADSAWFLMRVEFNPADFDIPLADLPQYFGPIARKFDMEWRLAQPGERKKMAIMVSKYDHCLVDLLYRHKIGELNCEIPLIISNHADNQSVADFYHIPFFVIPVAKDNKREAEQKQIALIRAHKADFTVLARYMQVLSNEFVATFPQRIINIHHSFLPAFVGAKPYHQAFQRGVKLIGATSHYVTEVLDDGPIIEQDVARISHRDSVEDLIQKGRDLEKVVLSRGVRWHIDDRVLLYGNKKTVVFD